MREKNYLLNGEPVDFVELIKEAEANDTEFANDTLKQTSKAAWILRHHGYTVSEAPKEIEITEA